MKLLKKDFQKDGEGEVKLVPEEGEPGGSMQGFDLHTWQLAC